MTEHLAVIVDLSDYYAGAWPASPHPRCERIPAEDRPTILHLEAESVEREALRLQAAQPDGHFVIFTATHCTQLQQVPTHVNLAGEPLRTTRAARLQALATAPASTAATLVRRSS
jgi:hypothetical protein